MSLVSRMSTDLQLPENFIMSVARSASYRYATYKIRKRRDGWREINHPSQELKALQRWLVFNEIGDFPVHDVAMAYRPGRNVKKNALRHSDNRFLLRLDLQSFFPSISSTDVDAFLQNVRPDWSSDDRTYFTNLVCRYRSLTIGAPTSPSLSNTVCYEMDARIDCMVRIQQVTYSRYADDMFFSAMNPGILGNVAERVEGVLGSLPYPSRLKLNVLKTHHSSRKNRRQVTGLIITTDGAVTIGRRKKREIRSRIHKYKTLTPTDKRSLAGYLAYVQDVEPDFLNVLILKYGKTRIDAARCQETVDGES